jgi:hypothetical protein
VDRLDQLFDLFAAADLRQTSGLVQKIGRNDLIDRRRVGRVEHLQPGAAQRPVRLQHRWLDERAELLKQERRIPVGRKLLGDLAAGETEDAGTREVHCLSRGRHAQPLTPLSPSEAPLHDDDVGLANQALDGEPAIRERGMESRHDLS